MGNKQTISKNPEKGTSDDYVEPGQNVTVLSQEKRVLALTIALVDSGFLLFRCKRGFCWYEERCKVAQVCRGLREAIHRSWSKQLDISYPNGSKKLSSFMLWLSQREGDIYFQEADLYRLENRGALMCLPRSGKATSMTLDWAGAFDFDEVDWNEWPNLERICIEEYVPEGMIRCRTLKHITMFGWDAKSIDIAGLKDLLSELPELRVEIIMTHECRGCFLGVDQNKNYHAFRHTTAFIPLVPFGKTGTNQLSFKGNPDCWDAGYGGGEGKLV